MKTHNQTKQNTKQTHTQQQQQQQLCIWTLPSVSSSILEDRVRDVVILLDQEVEETVRKS